MKENMNETYQTAFKAASDVASDAGQLMIKNMEKMIELQMSSARMFADTMLGNARDVLEIKDMQTVRTYFEKQPELTRNLVQKVAKDSGALMEIGQSYADEAQALLKKSTANFAGVAKAKAKKS
ncbi:MAG: phasin family protein [Gammaproteobacteria bacterium]|nr:phasin family protein [Gammaproteobacteria bacterium]